MPQTPPQPVAIQMSHSFRRNERQEASKNRQHPITKQTHRVPTDSNQSTYDHNARAPRQLTPARPPGANVPNSAHRGTFWDMTRDDWADALRDPLIEADETAPLRRVTQTRPLKGPNAVGGALHQA